MAVVRTSEEARAEGARQAREHPLVANSPLAKELVRLLGLNANKKSDSA